MGVQFNTSYKLYREDGTFDAIGGDAMRALAILDDAGTIVTRLGHGVVQFQREKIFASSRTGWVFARSLALVAVQGITASFLIGPSGFVEIDFDANVIAALLLHAMPRDVMHPRGGGRG